MKAKPTESVTANRITLKIPREASMFSIARLLVSGVAVRAQLTYEEIEDLKLAVDEVLELSLAEGDEDVVTLAVSLDGEHMEITLEELYERESIGNDFLEKSEDILEAKLFLLRCLVDEVRFRTLRPGAYRVQLLKDKRTDSADEREG